MTAALGAADDAAADAGDVDARGESLLLPLLQGLLGGGGERLLAGLGAAGADVVADVRRSLGRLRSALAPPTQHPQARALLALADRLEDALDAADRLDGCKRRPRRRTRASRHTVGVTHEELEEARRLVDRDQLALGADHRDRKDATPSTDSAAPSEEAITPDRRPSVDEDSGYHHEAVAARHKLAPVAHSASYEAAPLVSRDAQVVERRAPATRKPDFFRHSIADAQQQAPPTNALPRMERRPSEGKSGIAAIANKFNAQIQRETAPPPVRRAPANHPPTVTAPTFASKPASSEERKKAPLYKPLPPTYNFAAPPPAEDFAKPMNRFGSNKRLRMKRANTIDIGRPLAGYRVDSDTDEESGPRHGALVPTFEPRTENDKKFVAFMRKNEANGVVNGHANWSNRFGNIKNAFESRERDERSPSGGAGGPGFAGGARRAWEPPARRPLGDAPFGGDAARPPWADRREEPPRAPAPPLLQTPPAVPTHLPLPQSPSKHAPHTPPVFPSVCQSPTKPVVVKPFAAKPIPVNQFSHAPMSAFKPLKKITSPTSAPAHVWSPPSVGYPISPTVEPPPIYASNPRLNATSPPAAPWHAPEADRLRRTAGLASKFENKVDNRVAPPPSNPSKFNSGPLPPLTFVPQQTYAPVLNSGFPVKSIPSQSHLAAPELVKKLDTPRSAHDPSTQAYRHPQTYTQPSQPYDSSKQIIDSQKIDAQKLQIEFYEKQIRDKIRRDAPTHQQKAPAPPPQPYTVTDYTPANLVSTFVPLHQTPDIEKARAHKVDYLPDVVMNESGPYEYVASPIVTDRPSRAHAPKTKARGYAPVATQQNGDVNHAEDGEPATEHGRVETRVMRGPVRGAATITAGVRTRNDESRRPAADNLRGVLDKIATPRTPVERRRDSRAQVPASPLQNGHSPSPHAHATPPSIAMSRSPLAASRDSLVSAESASSHRSQASFGSSPLSRSGSWHQLAQPAPAPKAPSPRRIVSRAKSLHLLAIPKMFEGGVGREDVEKKRTVEAYFGGSNSRSQSSIVTATASSAKSHAATIKARAARSAPAQGGFALGRSRTMPTVSELQFLDESNTDDAFEDLVSGLA